MTYPFVILYLWGSKEKQIQRGSFPYLLVFYVEIRIIVKCSKASQADSLQTLFSSSLTHNCLYFISICRFRLESQSSETISLSRKHLVCMLFGKYLLDYKHSGRSNEKGRQAHFMLLKV